MQDKQYKCSNCRKQTNDVRPITEDSGLDYCHDCFIGKLSPLLLSNIRLAFMKGGIDRLNSGLSTLPYDVLVTIGQKINNKLFIDPDKEILWEKASTWSGYGGGKRRKSKNRKSNYKGKRKNKKRTNKKRTNKKRTNKKRTNMKLKKMIKN